MPRSGTRLWRCVVLKDPEKRGLSTFSGGLGEGETPLPIPNREVKPLSADGTWLARAWESRTPPVYLRTRAALRGGSWRCWPTPEPGPFGTKDSVRNPPCAEHPHKISPARRSRATLRRELAHRQDTNTPAHAAPQPQDASRPTGCATASCADALPAPSRRRSTLHRYGAIRQARPGRPPSRRRSRPRAARTSGSNAARRRGAA
jgi:hypothetical protein